MRILGIVLLLGTVWAGAQMSQRLDLPTPLKTTQLPWFAARDGKDADQPFTRRQLEAAVTPSTRRVALVYFATWCLPCRAGVRKLSQNLDALERHGVQVVLVNVGEADAEAVRRWVREFGSDRWPLIADNYGRLTEAFGLVTSGETMALPRTLLLDSKLKPLLLIGEEKADWPELLWK